jgi:hypothetical protein
MEPVNLLVCSSCQARFLVGIDTMLVDYDVLMALLHTQQQQGGPPIINPPPVMDDLVSVAQDSSLSTSTVGREMIAKVQTIKRQVHAGAHRRWRCVTCGWVNSYV